MLAQLKSPWITFWLIFVIIYGASPGAVIIGLKESTKRYVDDTVPPWKRA